MATINTIDSIRKKINTKYWNALSLVSSLFSLPTIGSPIEFHDKSGLRLKEYRICSISSHLFKRFIDFCYPLDMPNRNSEIEIDEMLYLNDASIFLVFNDLDQIVGSVMFLEKLLCKKLPIEYSRIASGNSQIGTYFDTQQETGTHKAVEIYRLRRGFDVKRDQIPRIVNMLFKAIWAKVIQSESEFLYCTCNMSIKDLKALYKNKLIFMDTGKKITYDNSDTLWHVYIKDCRFHEKKFATMSSRHFKLQNYFRKNLSTVVLGTPYNLFMHFLLYIRNCFSFYAHPARV